MHSSAGKTIAVVVASMMAASIVSGCQETGYAEHTGKTSESSFKAGSSAVSERSDSRTSALNSSVISESSGLPSEETDGEEVSEDVTDDSTESTVKSPFEEMENIEADQVTYALSGHSADQRLDLLYAEFNNSTTYGGATFIIGSGVLSSEEDPFHLSKSICGTVNSVSRSESEDGTLTVSAVILSESFAQEAIQIVRYPDSDEMLFRVDGMDEEFRVNVVSNASAASALEKISNALSTVSEDG